LTIARGLALACHPLPTLAVTAISAGLAALAHLDLATGVLLTVAVFTGQLSIGWSNDRIDAGRDRAVARVDKPLAATSLPLAVVTGAATVAVLATTAFSLALGWRAGLVALLTVAGGWAYNLGVKATALSWLPFALSFGLLPAIATLARPDHPWPAAWAVIAAALLGVAAHFANVVPDLGDDFATGIAGLPHRLGRRVSMIVGPLLLSAATAVIVSVGARSLGAVRWIVLGAVGVAAAIGVAIGTDRVDWSTRSSTRLFFLATMLIAGADVVLFGFAGGRLY
jgi:4-hydroxybenzoate polyprenyltransferase